MKCKNCHKPLNPEISHGWQVLIKDYGTYQVYGYYCYQCGLTLPEDKREYLEVGCNIYIAKIQ